MPIALHHVFVCCDVGAPEAEELVALGLTEGTPNVHPGQGTANRRFFFQGGFLELLWVADAAEARSPSTRRTRLWERWKGRHGGACPFGIAFAPTDAEVPAPPFETWAYEPGYLPPGRQILFARDTPLSEPELFYLAWPGPQRSWEGQPTRHRAPLTRLLSASVGLVSPVALSPAARAARAEGLLGYHRAARHQLILRFEAAREVELDLTPSPGLVLRGSASPG